MSCGITNKSLILNIEYIETDRISLTVDDFLVLGHSPVYMSSLVSSGNMQYIKSLVIEPETAKATFEPNRSIGGEKFKVSLTYSMNPPAEDATDVFNSLHNLGMSDFCFFITYFGGSKSFVYAPKNCMKFTYGLKEGKYEVEITVENFGGIQPVIL